MVIRPKAAIYRTAWFLQSRPAFRTFATSANFEMSPLQLADDATFRRS